MILIWSLTRVVLLIYIPIIILFVAPSLSFPWKCIWRVKALKRVSFFLWATAWGQILTIDNLVKRGLPLVNWCCMCQCYGETVDHLLLHCKYDHALWSEVFLMLGIQGVMPKNVISLMLGWRNWLGKHYSKFGFWYWRI